MYVSKEVKALTATLLETANHMALEHERYVGEFVTRGHQELYKILAAIYEIFLTIEQSDGKDYAIKKFRKELKEKYAIKTSTKTSLVAIIIRFVTRASTKTVSVYKRVLDAAYNAQTAPEDLSNFIVSSGGIDKCGKAIASDEEKKQKHQRQEFYQQAIVKYLDAHSPIAEVHFPSGKLPFLPGAADVNYQHLLCKSNHANQTLDVVAVLYPSSFVELHVLDTYVNCCMAAAKDDSNSNEFGIYCHENDLNMDLTHRWMKSNQINDHQAAKKELFQMKKYLGEIVLKKTNAQSKQMLLK